MKIPNRKLGWKCRTWPTNMGTTHTGYNQSSKNEWALRGWKEERSHYWTNTLHWALIPKSRGENQTKPTESSYCEHTVSPPGTQHDRTRTVSLINAGELSRPLNPRRNPVSGLECSHHRPVSSQCRDQIWSVQFPPQRRTSGLSNFLLMSLLEIRHPNFCPFSKTYAARDPPLWGHLQMPLTCGTGI